MPLSHEIIRAKRDGQELTGEAIRTLVNGIAGGQVSDAQIGAFVMAVHINGMTKAEQGELTLAMRDSGPCLHWPALDGPVLDKHSTGGVGDLVSLVLAPMLAACGAYVPMISGRGLGHTGGTLDKLESISGLSVNLAPRTFQQIVREAGLAMVGQSRELAPADGRMYAVRDVTATVDTCPLIVASILSKKLAEGLAGLVLDVKTGNGALICQRNAARDLAQDLVDVAQLAGLRSSALITDMNQPLASSAGNALEVLEAIAFLKNEGCNARLLEVVLALASELLLLSGLANTRKQAGNVLNEALESGRAADRFARMVALQGGPADLLERTTEHFPRAPVVRPLAAGEGGCVSYMDTRAIGLCVGALGGGRQQQGEAIDHRVGLSGLCNVGDMVDSGDSLVTIHAADEAGWQAAASTLAGAIVVGRKTDPLPAFYESIAPATAN
ncbi:MAG: thymidine phosphorylase [Lysobacterales bacterium]|jgi:thymidine phosphorylase